MRRLGPDIRRNYQHHLGLVAQASRAWRRGQAENALLWCETAARAAARFHPGLFADGRLENLIQEISQAHGSATARGQHEERSMGGGPARFSTPHWVHIATRLPATGGHASLLANLIRNCPDTRHSIALTDAGIESAPAALTDLARQSGGKVLSTGTGPRLERGLELRRLVQSADLAMLHHHHHDVVPGIAFGQPGGPPVVVMNHADQLFWLGTSVADLVISLRSYPDRLSRERRFARTTAVVPIALDPSPPRWTRAAARRELGLDETAPILLSMGSRYKFAPSADRNFLRTLGVILRETPSAHLVIVGLTEEEGRRFFGAIPNNCRLLGRLAEPRIWECAADVFLEPFPWGSPTAVLESAAAGALPLLQYGPTPQQDICQDPGLRGLVDSPDSEDEYLGILRGLLRNAPLRKERAAAVREAIYHHHTGSVWRQGLRAGLEPLAGLRHEARRIPDGLARQRGADHDLTRQQSPASSDQSRLLRIAPALPGQLGVSGLAKLWTLALSTGDSRLRPLDVGRWLRLFIAQLRRMPRAARSLRRARSHGT
jgi:hypothetical protein